MLIKFNPFTGNLDYVNEDTTGGGETLAQTLALGNLSGANDIIMADSQKVYFGTGSDAYVEYDGTDVNFKPDAVGSGKVNMLGEVHLNADSRKLYFGAATTDYTIEWDGSDAVHTITAGDFVFTGGKVGIGTTAPIANFHLDKSGTATIDASLYGASDAYTLSDNTTVALRSVVSGDFATYQSSWALCRTRGTLATPTIVQDGDAIGGFYFQGYDGAARRNSVIIIAEIDGTPGASDMPGRLIFKTTPDGSATAAERLRIDNAGDLHILADSKKLYFGAGDDCTIYYNGTHMILDPNLVGSGSVVIDGSLTTSSLSNPSQVGGTITGEGITSYRFSTSATQGAYMLIGKARGTVATGLLPLVAGDEIGKFNFTGYNNSAWQNGAQMICYADTVAAALIGTSLHFQTKSSTDAGYITALKMSQTQNVHIPTDSKFLYFGAGDDATITYNGTNMLINPDAVGTGYLNIQGKTLLDDKLAFTQTDLNEYIDSLNDGFMDYGATTAHRFLADVKLTADNRKLILGTGDDASIYYDGTDLYLKSDVVGSGSIIVNKGGYDATVLTGNSDTALATGTRITTIGSVIGMVYSAQNDCDSGTGTVTGTAWGTIAVAHSTGTADHNRTTFAGGTVGAFFETRHSGAGTLSKTTGFAIRNQNLGAGTITDSAGIRIITPTNSGGGTIGTHYGMYLDPQTTAGTNWGIYDLGNDWAIAADSKKMYFGAGIDSYIEYDGTNMNIKADAVGSGAMNVLSDQVFVGAGTGLPYGSCSNGGTSLAWSQVDPVQNTWYDISDADMVDGQLNLVTHDGNGQLTASKAGKYLICYSMCMQSTVANKHWETAISIDGTENAQGKAVFENKAISQEFDMTSMAILSLTAGQTVNLSVRTTDAGSVTVTVNCIELTVLQIGG